MRGGVAIKIVVVLPGVNNMIFKTKNIECASCSASEKFRDAWSRSWSKGWGNGHHYISWSWMRSRSRCWERNSLKIYSCSWSKSKSRSISSSNGIILSISRSEII
jgi:hypothetical protein